MYIQQLPDDDFKLLTGLPRSSVQYLLTMYEEWCQERRGPKPVLTPEEEMYFVLMWLRHYPIDLLMGLLFRVSEEIARRTRQKMLTFLYDNLRHRLSFGSLQDRYRHRCEIFGTVFTIILDGSEQPVLASEDTIWNTRFYSAKKKKTTINIVDYYQNGWQDIILITIVPRWR